MKKNTWAWIIAVLITVFAAYYQRISGPTYSKKATFEIGSQKIKVKLPRSGDVGTDCPVKIKTKEKDIDFRLLYHRFPLDEPYDTAVFTYNEEKQAYIASLPFQPAAGKLQYYIEFKVGSETRSIFKEEPVVIRFKGVVPLWILIIHVLLMFFGMLLSNLTGLLVISKSPRYKFYTWFTLILIFAGGLILGPVVQKYAFDAYWTGVPFGWDLTDNKLLVGFLVWLVAALGNIRKERPYLALVAALVLIIVYSIPHSLLGSELDYSSGKVITGYLLLLK